MTLSLVVLAGVASLFSTNTAVGRSSNNLSRMQETARAAVEMIAHDIREAGINDCGYTTRVVNLLNGSGSLPWASWVGGLFGYDSSQLMPGIITGAGISQRVPGTDALQTMRGQGKGSQVVSHDPDNALILLTSVDSLQTGDITIACDFSQASIFQVTDVKTSPPSIAHKKTAGVSPGNCSEGLGWQSPPDCGAIGNRRPYGANASVMHMTSVAWYVGHNGRGKPDSYSLFRLTPENNSGFVSSVSQEMFEGVKDLHLTYLLAGSTEYLPANLITSDRWEDVLAVKINMTVLGPEKELDSKGASVYTERLITSVVALRNRTS